MLRDLFGRTGADRGTALVFFSPGALVLSLVYTEAATILMVACALMALRRQRWVVAGLCAAVATTADPVGLGRRRPLRGGRRGGHPDTAPMAGAVGAGARPARASWRSSPTCGPTPGTPFAYFKAQRAGWQGGTYFNGIPGSFAHLFTHWFADPDYAVKAISALVAVGLLVIFFRARPPATWIGYVVAVLAFGAFSPVIGVTPGSCCAASPCSGWSGPSSPRCGSRRCSAWRR